MGRAVADQIIDQIINAVIDVEGGYSDHPSDRGGETKYGITEAVARANGYKGPMKDMPRSIAAEIYRARYVTRPRFDEVVAISPLIGEEVIDTGVNMGPHRAAEFLQRWLNGFNLPGSGYQDLFVDGVVGQLTLDALRRFLSWRPHEGERVLLRGLNSTQGNRYLELTEHNRSQREFLYGWVRARVVI